MSEPLVQVGDLIRVPEPDYHYRVGELRMRVTEVPITARIPDLEWIELVGVPVRDDALPARRRAALVRVASLLVPGRVVRRPWPDGPGRVSPGPGPDGPERRLR